MILDTIFELDNTKGSASIPSFTAAASAGPYTTSERTIDKIIDINEMLIDHPSSTFFAQVSGKTHFDKVKDGDTLIVDTSIKPFSGQLVCVARKDKVSLCKFLESDFGTFLEASNGDLEEIYSIHSPENQIVGVISKVIHHF
jgi:DNA polymerase V